MRRTLVFMIAVAAIHRVAAAETIPIHITAADGIADHTVGPIYVGVPLPANQTWQEENLRLVDAAGNEVPMQTETLATWAKDGPKRWVGVRFIGNAAGNYRIEAGSDVRRSAIPPQPLTIAEGPDAWIISTGAATFTLPKVGPLISQIAWGERVAVAQNDGCILVADQHGTPADETRGGAEEAPRVEVAGPLYAVVRRDGLLRTADGRRLGAYKVRLEFFAGQAAVKVQHTFINTEDSNAVQYSDIAFRLRPMVIEPRVAALDVPGGVVAALKPDESLTMMQPVFRHHGQRKSRFEVTRRNGSAAEIIAAGETAGDWAAVSSGNAVVAVTVPNFARTFPKEFEIAPDAFTAHLWSSRGGRLLDYRVASLIEHWGRDWIDEAYPGGSAAMSKVATNAQSTARTHDLWIDLIDSRQGLLVGRPVLSTRCRSRAVPPLAVVDGEWLYHSGALGPIPPVDEQRFPRIEHFLREFLHQYVVGEAEGWGDFGFLDYGCGPHNYGNPRANFQTDRPKLDRRYSNYDYNYRTSVWLHYARTGDRAAHDYAAAMNRHIADFKFSWFDAPRRTRGTMLGGNGSEENLWYWAGEDHAKDPSGMLGGHQGKDLENLLFQFYLTGDRHALDAVNNFAEVFLAKWDPTVLPNVGASSNTHMPLGFGAILYRHTWNERFREKTAAARDRVIDVNTTTGLVDGTYYGAVEKWNTRLWATVKDYETFADPVTAQALRQCCEYMLQEPPRSDSGYQDHSGLYAYWGWKLTGDVRFARWMNERLERLAYEYLDAEGNLRWTSPANGLAHGGVTSTFNVTESLIYGMALVAEAESDPRLIAAVRRPWLAASANLPGHPEAEIWFVKPSHRRFRLELLTTRGWDVQNRKPVESVPSKLWITNRGARVGPVEIIERPGYYERDYPGLGDGWARLTLPADAIGGEYRLSGVPAVVEHDLPKLVTVARDGVALAGTRDTPPTWYFQVPAGKQGTIYVSKPATVQGPNESPRPVTPDEPLMLHGGTRDELYALRTHSLTFVRFGGDIPAVLAQDDPELFFVPATDVQATSFTPPPAGELFADGLTTDAADRGLMMTGDRKLSIPLEGVDGKVIDYARGTIEFWVRPAWTTGGRPVPQNSQTAGNLWLGGGGFWKLSYADVVGEAVEPWSMSNLRFSAPGKPFSQDQRNTTPLRAGHWHHVAVCWETVPGRGWLSELYVDGRPSLGDTRFKTGLGRYSETGLKKVAGVVWTIETPKGDELTIYGGIDGVVDELRISNTARYPEPFAPIAARRFEADEHTTLLSRFDGNGDTINGQGRVGPTLAMPKRVPGKRVQASETGDLEQ